MRKRKILLVALVIAVGVISLSATPPTPAMAQSPSSSASLVARLPDSGASAICYSVHFHRGHLIIDWIDPMMRAAREYLSDEGSALFTRVGRLMPWLVIQWRSPDTAPAFERRTIDTPLRNLL